MPPRTDDPSVEAAAATAEERDVMPPLLLFVMDR